MVLAPKPVHNMSPELLLTQLVKFDIGYTMVRIIPLALLLSMLSACVIHVGPGSYRSPNSGEDSVFGDIEVASGQTVGDVDTVNGDIQIGHGATVANVSSVNGDIELSDNVSSQRISTVNGDIDGGKQLRVLASIDTVNGDLTLDGKSKVNGDITSVNGDVTLRTVTVAGNISNVNGDVSIYANSVITGDIVFKSNEDNSALRNERPTLVIDADVVVQGQIILQRPVELHLSNSDHLLKVEHQYQSLQ